MHEAREAGGLNDYLTNNHRLGCIHLPAVLVDSGEGGWRMSPMRRARGMMAKIDRDLAKEKFIKKYGKTVKSKRGLLGFRKHKIKCCMNCEHSFEIGDEYHCNLIEGNDYKESIVYTLNVCDRWTKG